MQGSTLLEEFVAAFAANDEERLVATMSDDVVLDGPFPIGKKSGPAKTATALLNVGKLGVKLGDPVADGDTFSSAVKSPAGAMVLRYTVDGDRIVRIDVSKP